MTKNFFFWGIYEGNEGEEMWETLHDYFEKLAGDDDVSPEEEVTKGKGATKK